MTLELRPPIAPMEALPVDAIPAGPDWQYEPKWDGFRCLAFRDGGEVKLQSKAGRPLNRYFPEMAAALAALDARAFAAKLYLVPFEPIQRETVRSAPEAYRLLLYRRLMLRIAEQLAYKEHAQAIVVGDSLGQVASQTLHNMVAVGSAARMPVFRPLAGDDKQEILTLARKIGTYEISAEPFHDCCPAYLPRTPALHATPEELDQAEAMLDLAALVRRGVETAVAERFRYAAGRIEQAQTPPRPSTTLAAGPAAALGTRSTTA